MVVLTRLDGSRIGLNSDQIERLDEGPSATVVTLMNGNGYIVAESIDTVVEMVTDFHTRVHSGPRTTRGRTRETTKRRLHLRLAEAADDTNEDQES